MRKENSVRVIAGKFKGKVLKCISNEITRPTTDSNKEMVFNTLGQFFDGGVALDLFGGTGSLGIEALSRGVSSAYFSEINPDTFKILKSNVESLNLKNATIFQGSYRDFLVKYQNIKFDLVLLDPPYRIYKDIDWILSFMLKKDMFKEGCQIVLEVPKEEDYKREEFEYLKEKTGAASKFIFLRYRSDL
ncbi:MAG: 16S rRNA (guanine(966)-N(2))-methyltransferase RsmD [Gammaproteobacteria bacterium]|nr:16S rRNA (guanine(966)-N(2))-methyltransferase RsmD [Gammaproteobacteria bacterium]